MAKVTKFESRYGISLELNEVWYKFQAGIEIELEDGDNIPEVKKKAHDTVQLEVEKQLQATIDALNDNKTS